MYGEYSGPVRWEDTYAPHMESCDFIRGDNEKSLFYYEGRDIVDVTFVDDNMFDAEEEDIIWASECTLGNRFECKELEWVPLDGTPIDYLGMHLSMDSESTSISMEYYIENCLDVLDWNHLKHRSRPMSKPIDELSAPLVPGKKALCTVVSYCPWISKLVEQY